MNCKNCDSKNIDFEVLERTNVGEPNEGYVWEYVCKDCDHFDTGYEF